jgi:hypothetical protein
LAFANAISVTGAHPADRVASTRRRSIPTLLNPLANARRRALVGGLSALGALRAVPPRLCLVAALGLLPGGRTFGTILRSLLGALGPALGTLRAGFRLLGFRVAVAAVTASIVGRGKSRDSRGCEK